MSVELQGSSKKEHMSASWPPNGVCPIFCICKSIILKVIQESWDVTKHHYEVFHLSLVLPRNGALLLNGIISDFTSDLFSLTLQRLAALLGSMEFWTELSHLPTKSTRSIQQADCLPKEALGSPEWVLISPFQKHPAYSFVVIC